MTLERVTDDVPRWMFLGILVYAPFAYGCRLPLEMVVLNQFAAALMVFWAIACLARRRWPLLPWLPTTLVTLLLLQGWWLARNAHSIHIFTTTTTVIRIWDHPPLPGWPGAIDRHLANFSVINVTSMLLLFLFACELMAQSVWRKRVWVTMALTATGVALLGTVLKLGGPPMREWLWGKDVAQVETTFAAYRYHGNAASLMSIGWTMVLGFVAVSASQKRRSLMLTGWLVALLGLLFGLALNTSRAGWALACFGALLVGSRCLWAWWCIGREDFDWKLGLLQGGVMLGVIVLLTAAGLGTHWPDKLARMETVFKTMEVRYHAEVYQQLAKETDLLGNGPDCFPVALPPYMAAFGKSDEKYKFWRNAHNDYYEYLVNWGWGGLILWAVLVFGGLMSGFREHFCAPVHRDSAQWMLGFCGGAAMLEILLHARWDFPLEIASILLFFLTLLADSWARLGTAGEALLPKLCPPG
ncbi:MAG: hypothetical protein EB141_16920 [Verrucomicrobia bacterium]|nr:hypothetical protein [Verrucomicrobiota bacterium]NBU07608.1 hypothetical protein [Pseudomonadota bacterium]NDA68525.1 hypothetical protein [Verrucomicrobiota bacterium]NDB77293.1 hypothetical protein [Verrucomicrobiota bacterium]NDD37013.1 hypothetical protein [Verrucomicrobiota bacterium]